jgi:hypothetical protein
VPAALLLPFLGKALNVDDPFFFRYAELIGARPLDPFRQAFWHLGAETTLLHQPQPLGWSYIMATAMAALGRSEVALHLPALAFGAWGLHTLAGLARRVGVSAAAACWLYAGSSAFLVMGSSLGPYVAWAAFATAAMARVVRGTDEDRARDLCLAGVFAGACFLCSFGGSVLLALVPAYPLLRGRPRQALVAVAAAAVVMLGYEAGSWASAGAPHFTTTLRRWSQPLAPATMARTLAAQILHLGAQLPALGLPIAAVAVGVRHGTAVCALSLAAALGLGTLSGAWPWPAAVVFGWPALSLLAAAGGAAAGALLRRARGRISDEEALTAFLGLWALVGTVANARYLHVSAKYFLLPLPAAILLALRWLRDARGGRVPWSRRLTAASVPATVALGLAVAWSDARWAATYRDAFRRPGPLAAPGGATFVNAEWGLRHYAERAGLGVYRNQPLAPGDRVLVSPLVPPSGRIPGQVLTPAGTLSLEYGGPLALMAGGAGFYSNAHGHYPFRPARRVLDQVTALEWLDAEALPMALVACDARARVFLDGRDLGTLPVPMLPVRFPLAGSGPALLAVEAELDRGDQRLIGAVVPAGARRGVSARWRCRAEAPAGWTAPGFDDRDWPLLPEEPRQPRRYWSDYEPWLQRAWRSETRLPRAGGGRVHCRWRVDAAMR